MQSLVSITRLTNSIEIEIEKKWFQVRMSVLGHDDQRSAGVAHRRISSVFALARLGIVDELEAKVAVSVKALDQL